MKLSTGIDFPKRERLFTLHIFQRFAKSVYILVSWKDWEKDSIH